MSDFIVEKLTKSVGDKTVLKRFHLLSMIWTVLGLLVSMGLVRQPC